MLLLTVVVAPPSGPTVHVAPTGSDAWTGRNARANARRTDGPFASLAHAVDAVRGTPGALVIVHGGTYLLDRTVTLDRRSAGLTIEAARGEKPTLVGGVPVSGWQAEGALWRGQVPATVAETGARLLVVDGQVRPRSRVPDTGELPHDSTWNVPWMSTTYGGWKRKPTDEELSTLRFRAGDVGDWLVPASAEVTVYHMWDESCVGVASIDMTARTLRFSTPAGHPPGAFGVQKWVVWNTRKGLTQPGQWFLDRRAKTLWYRPVPGERMDRVKAYLPALDVLISASEAPDVTIRGLALQVTNVPLKAGGFGAGAYDGAVTAAKCDRLRLEDLRVSAVAGTGIRTWACSGLVVRGCTVTDTGACGIRTDGDKALVEENVVRRVGLQYPSAIGIWLGGADAVVRHNEITDTSYSAMIGAGPGTLIEANRIARAMLVLHDGGGIYIGGTQRVALRGNWISDIPDTGGYGSSAYYLDEQCVDSVVEGNVSTGIARPSQNHMARGNTIRGNLFVTDGDMQLQFARCQGYAVQGNVLVSKGSIGFRAPQEGIAALTGNVLFGRTGKIVMAVLADYNETSRHDVARDGANEFADPGLRTTGKGRWTARIGGVARTWDVNEAGPRRRRY